MRLTYRHTEDGRTLASRHLIARLTGRHVNLIRRAVPAVACDVATRAALLDIDDAERELGAIPRRLTTLNL